MYYFSDDEADQPESIDDRLWRIKSCLSTHTGRRERAVQTGNLFLR